MENKFSKYLIYAIGEIILVVIGILIALSINTWNENKKNKIKEIKSLTELRKDLVQNLNDINGNISNLQICKNSNTKFKNNFKIARLDGCSLNEIPVRLNEIRNYGHAAVSVENGREG